MERMGRSRGEVEVEEWAKSKLGSEDDSDTQYQSDYDMANVSINDDEFFYQNMDQNTDKRNENTKQQSDYCNELCDSNEDDVVCNPSISNEHKLSDGEEEGPNYPVFNTSMLYDPCFDLGMIFSSKDEFRKTVNSYAIRTKRTLKFTKNHSCTQTFNVKNVKTKRLKKYLHNFQSDPKRNIKGFRVDIIKELKYNVSKDQAYRAKRKALQMLGGIPDHQYTKLRDYTGELKRSNPGSTMIFGTNEDENGDQRFSKFYCCFNALKMGFYGGVQAYYLC